MGTACGWWAFAAATVVASPFLDRRIVYVPCEKVKKMVQRIIVLAAFLAAACCLAPRSTDALVGAPLPTMSFPTTRSTSSTRLFSDTQETKNNVEFVKTQQDDVNGQEKPEPLSDLDARVLKSMLQDDKLDLKKEENMRKLLERGVAPKSAPTVETTTKQEEDESDSDFSSTLFKTLADTKLWKGLKRDANNILESVGIFVSNRIERDAKLLASVGLFAWERAIKDVGRALPATSSVLQKALGNSSSYEANLYEQLNTPMDEVRSVTSSIRAILKGDVATTGRQLRSVAPAGQLNSAERQKRAFRRRKISKLRQEKEFLNIQRAAGNVIDTAAQVRRELQVESSVPGYRTEGARKVIAAGAVETQRFLAAAKRDGWGKLLFAPKEKVKEESVRMLVGTQDIETVKQEADAQAVSQLLEERSRVIDRLDLAIANPGETWLTAEVVGKIQGEVDEDALREVVTAMIMARDQWEEDEAQEDAESLTAAEVVEKLRTVKKTVDSITSLASSCAGMAGSAYLNHVLYGLDEEGADSRPSLLTLDEVEPSIAAAVHVAESLPVIELVEPSIIDSEVIYDDGEVVERKVFAEVVMDAARDTNGKSTTWTDAAQRGVSQVNDAYTADFDKHEHTFATTNNAAYDPSMASVEVISDDDFDSAVGAKKVAVASQYEVEEAGKKEKDIIGFVLLRGLDILVLVIEKLFTSVIPGAIVIGSTASKRFADVAREGMGSKGWRKLENVQSGSKRY